MAVRSAILWSMSSQYAAFIIQFITSVIISRYFLLPAEVGLFSIGLAAAMLVSILQDFGLTRYISGKKDLDEAHIRVCSSISFAFVFVVILIIAALAWPMAIFYGEPRLFAMMLVIAASFLFVPFSITPTALLMRDMHFRPIFFVNVGGAVANGATALLLAWQGFSAESLAWALIAQNLARAVIAQLCRPSPVPLPLRFEGAKPIIDFGMATSALYIVGGLGTRGPDLIIGRLLSMTAVGLFSRATSLAQQLRTLVAGAIGAVFYPAFAKIHNRGDALGPPYLRVVSGYTAIIWPSMAMLAIAAEPVVLLLFGPNWAGVAPLLFWIAIAEMLFPALPLHFELPILLERKRTLFQLTVVDNMLALTLLLIGSLYGLQGAAISRFVYGIAFLLIYGPFLYRLLSFDARQLARIYGKSALVTVAAIGPFLIADSMLVPLGQMGFAALASCAIAGMLCWLAALFALRHSASGEIIGMLETLVPERLRAALGR